MSNSDRHRERVHDARPAVNLNVGARHVAAEARGEEAGYARHLLRAAGALEADDLFLDLCV